MARPFLDFSESIGQSRRFDLLRETSARVGSARRGSHTPLPNEWGYHPRRGALLVPRFVARPSSCLHLFGSEALSKRFKILGSNSLKMQSADYRFSLTCSRTDDQMCAARLEKIIRVRRRGKKNGTQNIIFIKELTV